MPEKTKCYPIIEIEDVTFSTRVRVDVGAGRIGVGILRVYKKAVAERKKQYYIDNKEKIGAYVSQWRKDTPEKVAASNKKWQQANPDKYVAGVRRWQQANPEKEKARWKAQRKDNPEKTRANLRQWRKANPVRAREHQHERRVYLSAYTDCEKLSPAFPGCDAHHLDPDTIIHIPGSLHRSVSHSLKTGWGMDEINHIAFEWLEGLCMQSPQTTLEAF